MPHRTFAQLAKRRLTGKEGKERIRKVRALLARATRLRAVMVRWPHLCVQDPRNH